MKNYIFEIFNGFQYAFTLLQANEIFRLVQLGLSILCTIILIVFRVLEWWKRAKADGKITADEIKEGAEIIEEGKSQLEKDLEPIHKPTPEELEDIYREDK